MIFKKLFFILSSLIIIVGLYTVFLSKDYSANNKYSKIFIEIENKVDLVKKIEIDTSENSVYLSKSNGKWEIANY